MNNTIKTIKNNYVLIIGVLIVGILIGWILFYPSKGNNSEVNTSIEHEGHDHETENPTIWTCSMHPQIKQDKPGQCPICAMDLIPLITMQAEGDGVDPNEIVLTKSAASLANIQTLTVTSGIPEHKIILQGKIEVDERNIAELTARFGGRIENLFLNFTGQNVKKGERLATIYSPDLVNAQKELLESAKFKEDRPTLYNSARAKLRLWDLTDMQIKNIEEKGEPILYFDVLSPITGTVTMRHVSIGDYVKEGTALFKVIDLSKVWVLFDAYERDLPWIRTGDKINFSIGAIPGREYSGRVAFIDPMINPRTRVAKVRVELPNPGLELKPEMFVNGELTSIRAESSDELIIPKTAVLWTGKRAVVYVKVADRESPSFLYREILLGPESGSNYIVAEGLNEGEIIAVNGVFKLDAASQLEGKPSMMSPVGGKVITGHNHDNSTTQTSENTTHTSVKVGGLCGMCKDRIETAALTVIGVESAMWESESMLLHLNYNKEVTNTSDIQKAIAATGHDTEDFKAPDDVYKNLPECCLYDRFIYN